MKLTDELHSMLIQVYSQTGKLKNLMSNYYKTTNDESLAVDYENKLLEYQYDIVLEYTELNSEQSMIASKFQKQIGQVMYMYGVLETEGELEYKLDTETVFTECRKIALDWLINHNIDNYEEEHNILSYAERTIMEKFGR